MNYLEIKDTPAGITATNKYTASNYPATGVYKSPDQPDAEIIFVDKPALLTSSMWITLSNFIQTNAGSPQNIIEAKETGFAQMVDIDTMLKAIAVGQRPELAFKK